MKMSESVRMPTRRGFVKSASAALTIGSRGLFALQPGSTGEGAIAADLAAPTVQVAPMLLGQFLEHFHRQVYGGVFEPGSPLSNEHGFRKDVLGALRELKIPIVRWPGGCFASAYHWMDGIGKNRQPSFDKAWGVEDSNAFGTDEFVEWCRAIGSEPYICTNAGTGTAEEMSNWVEYCNLPEQGRYARMRRAAGFAKPHSVRYWSIGNENYLGGEIGAKTVAEWVPLVREAAKMMRAVDSRIQVLVAATTQGDWTLPLLKEAGRYLDYISIHGYWDPLWREDKPSGYLKCMLRSEEPERQILDAIALLERTGTADRIKIAFDEWNLRGWHHPGFPGGGGDSELIARRAENDRNETYTMADAVFSGSFLNACLRHASVVRMACMAPVVNARGPLFVHSKGIVKRTTFHVLKMYADLLEKNVATAQVSSGRLESEGKSVAALDAVVTTSDDHGRIAVAAVNRHPDRAVECKLSLGLAPRNGTVEVTTLAGGSPDDYNDAVRPDRVVPEATRRKLEGGALRLPPHSVSIIRALA